MTGDVDFGFCYPEAFQQTQASLDRTLAGMAELRAKRVRILIPWSQTQIGPGNYNFAVTDAAVYSAVAHGLKPLLVYATFPLPPSAGSAADFGAWVGAFAKHYADVGVTDHELWNEQNAFGFWPGPPSAASYAQFLRAGYTAIKAVQPNSTVISGGMNPCGNGWLFVTLSVDPVDFLAGVYAAGGKGTFDAVGNHPYSIATSAGGSIAELPSATETYIVKDQKVYDVMVANGDGAKKIWHTEYGFPRSVVGAQNQKDWLQIQFNILSARPYVGPTFFYAYHDLTADTGASESTFGCVDFNYVKQPSWDFYDALNPAGRKTGTGALGIGLSATGTGNVNGKYGIALGATGRANLVAESTGAATVGLAGTGRGAIITLARSFSYAFAGTGSTKPTGLFTDFGLGYGVSGGVANATPATSGGTYYSGAIYNTACAGPDHFSSVVISGGALSPDRADLAIVRSDANGANHVHAGGTAWATEIATMVGGVRVVRASNQVGFGNSDILTIVADGPLYTVLKNNKPTGLTWTDNTGVFPGATNTRLGLGFRHVYSNGHYAAPGIDSWQGGDLRSAVAVAIPPPVLGLAAAGTGAVSTGAAPPAFDAVSGATNYANYGSYVTAAWTHTPVAAGVALVAFTSRNGGQTPASQTRTVTYGGVAMTLLATVNENGDTFTEIWGLTGASAAPAPVVVTISSGGNTGRSIAAGAITFTGVSSFGLTATANATSSTPSLTIGSAPGEIVLNAIGGASATESGYTKTSRLNVVTGDGYASLLIGHAAGASSVNFGATQSSWAAWAAAAVRLIP